MPADVIGLVVARMHDDGSWWWTGGMMFWMVLFWAAVILGGVWLVRRSHERPPRRGQEPLEILDQRLAEGAISLEEYQERRAILTGEQAPRANPSADRSKGTG